MVCIKVVICGFDVFSGTCGGTLCIQSGFCGGIPASGFANGDRWPVLLLNRSVRICPTWKVAPKQTRKRPGKDAPWTDP
jgi:hypothetical protein